MADRIKGITVEINGDTAGLNKSLGDVNKMVRTTQSELQNVEKLLKLDPTNTDLLAQKQSLLAKEIGLTSDKLEGLKRAAQEAYAKMQSGEISLQQYQSLQAEIVRTTEVQKKYTDKLESMHSASNQLKDTIAKQKSELSELKTKYTDIVLEQGKDSDAAIELKQKYDQLNEELSQNTAKLDAAETAAKKLGQAEQSAQTPLESLKETISKQESELSKLSTEYQNACMQYGKNSTEAQQLATKMKSLSEEHQSCTKQLSTMESEAKKLTTAEQGLTDKLASQKQDLSKLKQEYVDATEKYGKHSSEANSLKEQIKKLSGEIADEESTVKKASEAADKFDKSMKSAGDSAKAAGEKASESEGHFSKLASTLGSGVATGAEVGVKAFTAYTGAAAALGATVATTGLTTFSEFESQMSTVKALMSGSCETTAELEQATAKLSEKAKELGSTTAFTSTEVGQAMEYMAMAGWSTEDVLSSVSGVMNLAAASGEDLATVSDIVTDSMTAFGLAADGEFADGISNATHYADVLAAASTSANTNVSLMGETFKYVAPIAGTLGYSAEDTAVAVGLMANAGIKGSQAGTSLKTALANLASPTDKQATAMEQLGISLTNTNGETKSLMEVMGNLRSSIGGTDVALTDADGNLRSYEEILADVSKTTDGLSKVQQIEAASTIFGKEAMAGMLSIINASDEDFAKLSDSIYNCNGAAEEMAQIKLDNLKGSIPNYV